MSDSHDSPARRPETELAHLGRDPAAFLGAVNTPVFRASTMLFPTMEALLAASRGQFPGIAYGLHGLPTFAICSRPSPRSKADMPRTRCLPA